MTSIPNKRLVDPIAALVEARGDSERGSFVVPLVAVRLDVTIRGGLLVAEVTRSYRNDTENPIEALLTFPVPISATCYELKARIGDRTLLGVARESEAARETYEDAMDTGKAAVLYEELLPGIHMLSVGNLEPGGRVDVSMRWADSIRVLDTWANYRIPMTLGHVYGRSRLPETDELVTGGPALRAEVRLAHDARSVMIEGESLVARRNESLDAKVPTDAPIDIKIAGWKPGALSGASASRSRIQLEFGSSLIGEDRLDVAILVDASGSMGSPNEGAGPGRASKLTAVKRALKSVASLVRAEDRFSLWTFNLGCRAVLDRSTPRLDEPERGFEVSRHQSAGADLAALARRIGSPTGGTAIGQALDASESGQNRDVLLVTDGLSHDLDPFAHAQSGRRVFVVLVGEDSLDARVGHLAALTGGDVHYSFGGDILGAMTEAIRRLRSPWAKPRGDFNGQDGRPRKIQTVRGGLTITARWGESADSPDDDPISRAVASFATGLALPAVESEGIARRLAIEEGLITRFSSLVLVDEDGPVQIRLAEFHKVPLPEPRVSNAIGRHPSPVDSRGDPSGRPRRSDSPTAVPTIGHDVRRVPPSRLRSELRETDIGVWLATIGRMVNWTRFRDDLRAARLEHLPLSFTAMVRLLARILAERGFVGAVLRRGHDDPTYHAIALVAATVSDRSGAAARVYGDLVPDEEQDSFEQFAKEFVRIPRSEIEAFMARTNRPY